MSVNFIFIYVTSKTEVAMFQAVDSKHKNYIKYQSLALILVTIQPPVVSA